MAPLGLEAIRDALEDVLDGMADDGELFMGKYELYNSFSEARPSGGQGIVQFARWTSGKRDVAIKARSIAWLPALYTPITDVFLGTDTQRAPVLSSHPVRSNPACTLFNWMVPDASCESRQER